MTDHEQNTMEGIPQEAIDLYERADPKHAEEKDSMELLREAVRISPEFFDAHFDFALAALSFGRDNHAKIERSRLEKLKKEISQSLDKCIELRPGLAPPHAWKACIAYLSKDYRLGIKHADKAFEIDDSNFEANLYKGCNYLGLAEKESSIKNAGKARENAKQAVESLSRARSVAPDSFEAVYSLAAAHQHSGYAGLELGHEEESHCSFVQALRFYREAIELPLDPKYYSGQMALAHLHCARVMRILLHSFGPRYSDQSWRTMHEEIIERLTAAINYKPDFAWAYMLRSTARANLQRLDEARDDLIEAQKYSNDPRLDDMRRQLELLIRINNKSKRPAHAARQAGQAGQAEARA